MIHAGAELDRNPGSLSGAVAVRLAVRDSSGGVTTLGTSTMAGASVWLAAGADQFGATVPDLWVVVFSDTNQNGQLDAGEPFTESRDRFRVITRDRFDVARRVLNSGIATLGSRYPLARTLLNTFVLGVGDPEATLRLSTVSSTDLRLAHTTGIRFSVGGPDATGTIWEYRFGPQSGFARAILTSTELARSIAAAARGSCVSAGSRLRLPDAILFEGMTDLGLSLHDATLDAQLVVSGGQVWVTGYVRDLYDWDFDGAGHEFPNALMDPMAASVQAGYATLSDISGEIFHVEIELNGPTDVAVCGPPAVAVCDQLTNIRLIPAPYGDPDKAQAIFEFRPSVLGNASIEFRTFGLGSAGNWALVDFWRSSITELRQSGQSHFQTPYIDKPWRTRWRLDLACAGRTLSQLEGGPP